MNEHKFSLTQFERGILLNISMEEAYKYAGTSNGISKWFIGEAIYTAPDGHTRPGDEPAQKGDKYTFNWVYKDLSLSGEVLDANGKDFVSFTFGGTATFNIKLSELDGRVFFNLSQISDPDNPMPEMAHINCYVCWSFFLLNLKSVAENGFDLREWDYDMEGLANW